MAFKSSAYGLVVLFALPSLIKAADDTGTEDHVFDDIGGTYMTPIECDYLQCVAQNPKCLEYRKDIFGCDTCTCLYSCPERECPNNCTKGTEYFTDIYGCRSCRCKQPAACHNNNTCNLYCREGYKKDDKGCNRCACRPCGDLCNIPCQFGKLVDYDGCFLCECRPNLGCGPVCPRRCLLGRARDNSGCPKCQCLLI